MVGKMKVFCQPKKKLHFPIGSKEGGKEERPERIPTGREEQSEKNNSHHNPLDRRKRLLPEWDRISFLRLVSISHSMEVDGRVVL
jgi:hypothetical protein